MKPKGGYMKVTICSCARCTANSNDYLYESATNVVKDLYYAYQLEELGDVPEIEIGYANLMRDIENPESSAPVVKIDDKYFLNAKPEGIMEHIFNEFTPDEHL